MSEDAIWDYKTVRGYEKELSESLSSAMEDYLEMTARLSQRDGFVKIGTLSAALHVKPSSASKMVAKLKASGYLTHSGGGDIYLTASGSKTAEYLLYRHKTIESFLLAIGSENALRETELIEHFLSVQTVDAIREAMPKLKDG